MAELAAGMKMLEGRIDRRAPEEFAHVAQDVAGDVRSTVPRLTGRLAGTVSVDRSRDGASITMGNGVPYAQFVEYGGRGHPRSAQGNYLYPAAMDAGPRLQDAGEQAARREIGAMSWPSP
ncbi:MAG TPA: HK97 gp10 family phage protein [Acidimicrobiales bacterium]|nr:HK97 gp10 family phage protein [Acidimicrobiales bacterium]